MLSVLVEPLTEKWPFSIFLPFIGRCIVELGQFTKYPVSPSRKIWLITSYNVKKTLNSIWHAKSPQLCQTLCNPIDCSPPDPSVHGILQARIQECIAIPFFRGSSQLRDPTLCLLNLPQWQAGFLPLVPPGKQMLILFLFGLRFFFFNDSLWDGWFFIFGLGEFEEMYSILDFL